MNEIGLVYIGLFAAGLLLGLSLGVTSVARLSRKIDGLTEATPTCPECGCNSYIEQESVCAGEKGMGIRYEFSCGHVRDADGRRAARCDRRWTSETINRPPPLTNGLMRSEAQS